MALRPSRKPPPTCPRPRGSRERRRPRRGGVRWRCRLGAAWERAPHYDVRPRQGEELGAEDDLPRALPAREAAQQVLGRLPALDALEAVHLPRQPVRFFRTGRGPRSNSASCSTKLTRQNGARLRRVEEVDAALDGRGKHLAQLRLRPRGQASGAAERCAPRRGSERRAAQRLRRAERCRLASSYCLP